jgi:hypothetical protein
MSVRWKWVGLWAVLFVLATALEFVRNLFLPRDGNFLLVTSPPGEGTVVVAELPCGS